jgi:hypothetical protein
MGSAGLALGGPHGAIAVDASQAFGYPTVCAKVTNC